MREKHRGKQSCRRATAGADRGKSLGSSLDEIGFQPHGHRIVIGSAQRALRWKDPAAGSARYDRSSGRIVVEFCNGSAFMVPARLLQGLVDALESDIAEVELSGEGGLHWERLDIDHEIGLLMTGTFGTPEFMAGRDS